jgi:hypothetical protein
MLRAKLASAIEYILAADNIVLLSLRPVHHGVRLKAVGMCFESA